MPQLALVETLSPSRAHLRDAQAALDRATRSAPVLSDAIARLDRAQADEAGLLLELADLEASEDAKLKRWAVDPQGPAPTLDNAKRSELDVSLMISRNAAEAARRVAATLQQDHAVATAEIEAAKQALDDAAAAVVIEDLEQADRQLTDDIAKVEDRILAHFVATGEASDMAGSASTKLRAKMLSMRVEQLMDRGRLTIPPVAQCAPVSHSIKQYFGQLHDDPSAQMPALRGRN